MNILRLMKADFLKMKHTLFYWLHICLPIIAIVIFLGYYSFAPFKSLSKVTGYFDGLSLAFPPLIGIITSMVIEQEMMAGKFKEMLSTEHGRTKAILSKILTVLVMGLSSLAIAIIGFFIGFQYILKQNPISFKIYLTIILIIFASQIFIYLFHLWLSIKFGSGSSIGMGIFEGVISMLIITGLGDGIWQWIPCGWCIRFCNNLFIDVLNKHKEIIVLSDLKTGISINAIGFRSCFIFTTIFLLFLIIWFKFFEGRNNE